MSIFATHQMHQSLLLTRCIIEQYGNYTVEVEGETLNVNGINSQVRMVISMMVVSLKNLCRGRTLPTMEG